MKAWGSLSKTQQSRQKRSWRAYNSSASHGARKRAMAIGADAGSAASQALAGDASELGRAYSAETLR